jgi:hypothetical protein
MNICRMLWKIRPDNARMGRFVEQASKHISDTVMKFWMLQLQRITVGWHRAVVTNWFCIGCAR